MTILCFLLYFMMYPFDYTFLATVTGCLLKFFMSSGRAGLQVKVHLGKKEQEIRSIIHQQQSLVLFPQYQRLGAGHGGRMFVLLCTRASCSKVSALCSATELGAIAVVPHIKSSLVSCSMWQAPVIKAHTPLQTHIPSQCSACPSNFAPTQKNPLFCEYRMDPHPK